MKYQLLTVLVCAALGSGCWPLKSSTNAGTAYYIGPPTQVVDKQRKVITTLTRKKVKSLQHTDAYHKIQYRDGDTLKTGYVLDRYLFKDQQTAQAAYDTWQAEQQAAEKRTAQPAAQAKKRARATQATSSDDDGPKSPLGRARDMRK